MSIVIVCPHCGHKNHAEPANLPTSIYCNVDAGGCDKLFLYSAEAKVTYDVKVYVLPEPTVQEEGGAA